MASLLKSIANWWRGKKDSAAEALKDPVRDGKFAIEDSEERIREFQKKVAQFMAVGKQIDREITSKEKEVAKWDNIARKAASAGKPEDVAEAVQAKQRAEQVLSEKKAQQERNEAILQKLRDQLQSAMAKVAQAKSNYAQLVARHEGAKVRKELAEAASEFGGDGALAELNDLQKAVDSEESEAEAFEELAGETGGPADLEDKYGAGSDADVDAEVARLMAEARRN